VYVNANLSIEYLLLYTSKTAGGSSGGPKLKASEDELEIVDLHRGGHKDHYNCRSKFSEIIPEKKITRKKSMVAFTYTVYVFLLRRSFIH